MKTIARQLGRILITLAALMMLALFAGRNQLERLAMWSAEKLAVHAAQGIVFTNPAAMPEVEAAIIPGASIRSPHLRARAETAAALFHAGKVRYLFLSGDGREAGYHEPAALRRMLRELGVPDSAMTEDPAGLSTWETLERARHLYGLNRAVVITQAYHAPRVALLARHFYLDLTVCCAASPADTRRDEYREARARVRAIMDMAGLRGWTATCEADRCVTLGRLELARW
jgi:vancomycin permeability regulator SanA